MGSRSDAKACRKFTETTINPCASVVNTTDHCVGGTLSMTGIGVIPPGRLSCLMVVRSWSALSRKVACGYGELPCRAAKLYRDPNTLRLCEACVDA